MTKERMTKERTKEEVTIGKRKNHRVYSVTQAWTMYRMMKETTKEEVTMGERNNLRVCKGVTQAWTLRKKAPKGIHVPRVYLGNFLARQ